MVKYAIVFYHDYKWRLQESNQTTYFRDSTHWNVPTMLENLHNDYGYKLVNCYAVNYGLGEPRKEFVVMKTLPEVDSM